MTFTTIQLTGERVLVRGTDSTGGVGETVLDSTQWNQVKAQRAHAQAHDQFDDAVEAFFAPLLDAAELIGASVEKPEVDPSSYVLVREGTEGVAAEPAVVVKLDHDAIVLRLLEEGQHNRLVWVNDSLEVLAQAPVAPPVSSSTGPIGHDAGL